MSKNILFSYEIVLTIWHRFLLLPVKTCQYDGKAFELNFDSLPKVGLRFFCPYNELLLMF